MIRNRPGPRTARLRLEHLEDRSVPSTFTVNTTLDDVTPANGKFSLREAITKANTTAGADVIVVPAGVFKLTQVGTGENANATGDFDITGDVTIQGAAAGLTIIDGLRFDRVIDVLGSAPSSIKVVLQGLTVRHGNIAGSGGGIQVDNADLVVRDCTITDNKAQFGGGIDNDTFATGNVTLVRAIVARNVAAAFGGGIFAGALTVKDSTVRRNLAGGEGGGIAAETGTLTNCTISGNSAAQHGGGILTITGTLTNCTISGNFAAQNGGGIRANTSATLTRCTVSGNTAGNEGGGIHATTSATLTRSTVSGNRAEVDGGGIWGSSATLTNSTVSGNSAGGNAGGILTNTATLNRCTVSGNSAGATGGGILAPTATLTNTTVSGNSAANEAGGIWATAAALVNCTIAENSAGIGGGLFHNPGGIFSVKNTIVALNVVNFSGSGPDLSGGFTDGGHNLIGIFSGSTGIINGINGNIVGTLANSIDPKLGPLANNGGPTKTHALLAGSLAIDHGDNAGAPATDQRGAGFPRKKDGNFDGSAVVDIGAFEK
jgi:CSLREA domain-containing protein